MNPVNINFDRPNFDKTNSARNLEVVNRWITDTADKLNVLAQKMVTGEVKVNEAASIDYSTIRNIVNKTSLVDLIAAYDTYSNFPETGKKACLRMPDTGSASPLPERSRAGAGEEKRTAAHEFYRQP